MFRNAKDILVKTPRVFSFIALLGLGMGCSEDGIFSPEAVPDIVVEEDIQEIPDVAVEEPDTTPDTSCSPETCTTDNPCEEAECIDNACVQTVKTGTSCDDGDNCTQDDSCNEKGECSGSSLDCNDDEICTIDGCSDGECFFVALAGDLCDDGEICTEMDACNEDGACVGSPVECPDGGPCEEASCDPIDGCVLAVVDAVECDDGSLCTDNDVCLDGICSGTQKVCEAENCKTSAGCDLATGDCNYEFATDGAACDDDSLCTLEDSCFEGTCTGLAELVCDDGNACTMDTCSPVIGCISEEILNPCDDMNSCTSDSCDPMEGCIFSPIEGECEDGLLCTENDYCASGSCIQGMMIQCDDNNICTNDACDPLTGTCLFNPNGKPCDDDNICTEGDTCSDGLCSKHTLLNCEDGLTCTENTCDPEDGCITTPLTGLPCEDGSTCTISDSCVNGACTGGADYICDDSNECTLDECVEGIGCQFEAALLTCDDGDVCTTDGNCVNSICLSGTPLDCDDDNVCTIDSCDDTVGCVAEATEGPCSDGSVCTYQDTCENGVCVGTLYGCNDDNVCTQDTCDPKDGCQYNANSLPCDDGNICTLGDFCDDKICAAGPSEVNCDDGNFCTDEDCTPSIGCVVSHPEKGCNDNNFCTIGEKCLGGLCQAPDSFLDCDDNNMCTTDSCSPVSGCVHTNNTTPCNDGSVCTVGDFCALGSCSGFASSLNCEDGNECTLNQCDATLGCFSSILSGPCDDGNTCTTGETCSGGTCTGGVSSCDCTTDADCAENSNPCIGDLICDTSLASPACVVVEGNGVTCEQDDNPCTVHVCSPESGGACIAENAENSTPCEDGEPCTEVSVCINGTCEGTAFVQCDDGNECTDDFCIGGNCSHIPGTNLCDDADACTENDTCDDGACEGTALNCDDGNSCTLDDCEVNSGCTHIAQSGIPCVDESPCTTFDSCLGLVCVGVPVNCNDGNPCTDDICDAETGDCVHEHNTGFCEDGLDCTSNDVCLEGVCEAGTVDCDDGDECTANLCDEDGCSFVIEGGLPCSDGEPCTELDICDNDGICTGTPLTCEDGPCAQGTCIGGIGCVYDPVQGPCDDEDPCTTFDQCNNGLCEGNNPLFCEDGNPCTDDSCETGIGCVSTNNSAPCFTGDICSQDDACSEGVCATGVPFDCEDGNPCTTNSCDNVVGCVSVFNSLECTDGNLCIDGGTCSQGACLGGQPKNCDDANSCTEDSCEPDKGCLHVDISGPCNDGAPCTENDTCIQGQCLGIADNVCNDNNPCTDDSCDDIDGCIYANNASPCEDGNICTAGDTCLDGVCSSGSSNCDDDNICTVDACSPEEGCLYTPQDIICDDGHPCTQTSCIDGKCTFTGPIPCGDLNPCTTDNCTFEDGCFFTPNNDPCDDDEVCTAIDECLNGECVGIIQTNCDDGSVCTFEECDSQTGCKYTDLTPEICIPPSPCAVASCDPIEGCKYEPDDNLCTIPPGAPPCTIAVCNVDTGCAFETEANCCGNLEVELGANEECDDGNFENGDGCSADCKSEAQGIDCADIKFQNPSAGTELYMIDPDGFGGVNPFSVFCEMSLNGGGWSIVAIVSDDGDTNWTVDSGFWGMSDNFFSTFSQTVDTRTPAMNYAVAHDMLFSHAPTQAWAIYKGVQSDDVSLGEFIESIPYGTCWEGQNGIPMADGTISATGGLCSTDLFFNGADQEGTNVCGGTDYTVGPHWNVGLNGTCPFNGPGSNASLGPTGLNPAAESNAIGFSKALGFNFNTNAMRVFVRRAICGNGVVEGNEECDNGLNGTPLCTAECIIP